MKLNPLPTMCLGLLTVVALNDLNISADRQRKELVNPSESGAQRNRASNWTVTTAVVSPAEDLVDLEMLDAAVGKIVSAAGSIFETNDGGLSWQRLSGGLPDSDYVRMSFVNKSVGWAVVCKPRASSGDPRKGYDASLMRTNDGGRSWTVQYTVRNGALNQIRFANEREGWALGSRQITGKQGSEQMLILHTVDAGRHWRDVSQRLGEARLDDSAADIFLEAGSRATIVTFSDVVLVTEDRGTSWHEIKTPKPKQQQLSPRRVLRDQAHHLWILDSANSREVTATRVARMNAHQNWVTTHLPDWYISDLRILSPTQIFACGFRGEKSPHWAVENGEGLLVFSGDDGQSWSVIYGTKGSPRINTLAVLSPDKVIAVGDKGWVFHLVRSSSI